MDRSESVKAIAKSTGMLVLQDFNEVMNKKAQAKEELMPEDLQKVVETHAARLCAAYEQNLAFYHSRYLTLKKNLESAISKDDGWVKAAKKTLNDFAQEDKTIHQKKKEVVEEYQKSLKKAGFDPNNPDQKV